MTYTVEKTGRLANQLMDRLYDAAYNFTKMPDCFGRDLNGFADKIVTMSAAYAERNPSMKLETLSIKISDTSVTAVWGECEIRVVKGGVK